MDHNVELELVQGIEGTLGLETRYLNPNLFVVISSLLLEDTSNLLSFFSLSICPTTPQTDQCQKDGLRKMFSYESVGVKGMVN